MTDFVIEITKLRKKIATPNSLKGTLSDLQDLKASIIAYLNMINFLKGKIAFGSDQYSLKIEFTWSDTVKDSNNSSYNVNHEIYANLFNLALCNNFIMKLIDPDSDEELKVKETLKNLEFSAGIIEKIKIELPTLMPEKEIPIDMSDKYLQFVLFFVFYFYLYLFYFLSYSLVIFYWEKRNFFC